MTTIKTASKPTVKQFVILLLCLSGMTSAFAQSLFRLGDASPDYRAEIAVHCKENMCEGPGTVRLFSKKTGKHLQTLNSDNLFIFLNDRHEPSVNITELYGEQSALIFDDFNFDGHEDLAVRNGNLSSYGGPSYNVYVYNISRKKFVLSAELTELACANLGMFHVDRTRKRLVAFSKSGCCWHLATEYEVVPGKGLLKVYELEEDATSPEGKYVTITTRERIKGKWTEKTEKKLITEYYPEQ